jgi:hypothetical protein
MTRCEFMESPTAHFIVDSSSDLVLLLREQKLGCLCRNDALEAKCGTAQTITFLSIEMR